tara:strand:+ start:3656 stop:4504 length:849 start_codon:yes stop_codon:yes gene_type:complete
MALDKITKVSGGGVTEPLVLGGDLEARNGNFSGILTATSFSGSIAGTASSSGYATTSFGLEGTPDIVVGSVTGTSASFSGNVSIAGTLTYEDVTNIDSVGIITARSDVKVGQNLSVVGVTTLSSAGGITTTGGDLYVAGVVTASDYKKSDGSPISGSIGIQSAGTVIGTGFTSLNFIGAGNTFLDRGNGNIDISISGSTGGGGGGGGLGTAIAYEDGELSPFSYVDKYRRVTSNLNMTNVNAGASESYIVSVSPNIIVDAGIGVTVGAGKTMIIDVLKIGDL